MSNRLIKVVSRYADWLPSPPQVIKRARRDLALNRAGLNRLPEPMTLERDLSPRISASLEDRWAILGTTGSGKTTFAKALIQRLRSAYPGARVYILDSKLAGDFDGFLPGARVIPSGDAPAPIREPGGMQIWQPPEDDGEQYDRWLRAILKAKKPAIVYIDELASLGGTSARSFPAGYALLQKLGRGLHVCSITCSQEAAYIPRQLLGQMTHLVRFGLLDGYDTRKVDKLLDRPQGEIGRNPPTKHGFLYRRTDGPHRLMTFRDLREFF